jgi:DNA mismatch repair protein MutS2
MTSSSLQVLDFTSLKKILTSFTDSLAGALNARNLLPLRKKDDIVRELEVTGECTRLLESGSTISFRQLVDCSSVLQKLAVEGVVLEPQEILEIGGLAQCAHATKEFLVGVSLDAPRISALGTELPGFGNLLDLLRGKISPAGEVEDHASPKLKRIRNDMNVLRNRLYDKLGSILQKRSSSQIIQDDVITIRNERFVIPVKAESKKEMSGVVHGTSSSGATLFLEPLEILELNNELVRLKEQAAEEVRNVLIGLTLKAREQLGQLNSAVKILGYLDFCFAKSRFAKKFHCIIPEINEGQVLSIVDGRHPILEANLKSQNKEVVPVSVALNATRHILVISGPNTGGKTVALKTFGLLSLMALSGLPIPATSANICFFDEICADIGDRQSIDENLSTFSSHLVNIREILENVSTRALVLLDELGTGTDPEEGSALGVAIVEWLRRKGVTAVVTTHHNGLKSYASTTPGVSNASVEFDETSLRPTFRLLHGVAGSSSGLEIAERLGLDKAVVAHARSLVSGEHQQIEEFSKKLREQIDENTRLGAKLQSEVKALELQKKACEERLLRLEAEKKRELEQIQQNAFVSFERDSRSLLAEIRDKYLTVRARREIEKKGGKLREEARKEVSAVTARTEAALKPSTEARLAESRPPILVGCRVRVKRFGREGTVVSAHGDGQWEVVVGNFKCVVGAEELELTGIGAQNTLTSLTPSARVMLQMNSPELQSNEINLVGCTVDEALDRVDKFLDSAFLASISQVRLIHGTGMGILRKALLEWLSHQPFVARVHPAEASQGGNGVTVVSLKSE